MTKQVIILRKDLNMRKGKMCAQAGHAALDAALTSMHENTAVFNAWLTTGMTKIVVGVDSLDELIQLQTKALSKGLTVALIIDAARTEFKEPTITALAIGPADENAINPITGQLKLL
jgi:peptidyl-tRNA hydrolase, PTH2 family